MSSSKPVRLVVAGFRRTGQALARIVGKWPGYRIVVTDLAPESDFKDVLPEMPEGIEYEFGGHNPDTLLNADMILSSPGVLLKGGPLDEAYAKGVPIIGDLEFAYLHSTKRIAGITGSKGKTTTTLLTGAIFEEAGIPAFVGGNTGNPMANALAPSRNDKFLISEISSYQLDLTQVFRPVVGALLNLGQDHLDVYDSVSEYHESKFKMFRNQRSTDYAVLNADDPLIREQYDRIVARIIPFSRKQILPRGVYLRDGWVESHTNGITYRIMPVEEIPMPGLHNVENTLAAVAIARLCGIGPEPIRAAIRNFELPPHRMQELPSVGGVKIYNDSKSTSPDSVACALDSFPDGVHLILGGKEKRLDYAGLAERLRKGVKTLILIGETSDRLRSELGDCTTTISARTLDAAVERAFERAEPGDIILLSPGTSSFDQFRDFEERGEVFAQLAARYAEKRGLS